MSLINLICPHCSENFELDSDRPLQSFWVCPHCGNRSLLQKIDDTIRLRGILSTRPNQANTGLPPVTIQSTTTLSPESNAELTEAQTPPPKDWTQEIAQAKSFDIADTPALERPISSVNPSDATKEYLSGRPAAAAASVIPDPPEFNTILKPPVMPIDNIKSEAATTIAFDGNNNEPVSLASSFKSPIEPSNSSDAIKEFLFGKPAASIVPDLPAFDTKFKSAAPPVVSEEPRGLPAVESVDDGTFSSEPEIPAYKPSGAVNPTEKPMTAVSMAAKDESIPLTNSTDAIKDFLSGRSTASIAQKPIIYEDLFKTTAKPVAIEKPEIISNTEAGTLEEKPLERKIDSEAAEPPHNFTDTTAKMEPPKATSIFNETIETPPAQNRTEPTAIEPPVRKTDIPIAPQSTQKISDVDNLYHLAEEAAKNHDFPLFNVYSRQAIDCQPNDARIYALRSRLTEEADGFARATWDALGWTLLTTRRKQTIIAQHLFNFNTAIKYGGISQQQDFIRYFAWQLVRQAIEIFTENAEQRCQKNLFNKTFAGRFKMRDLKSADKFIDAINLINQQTCPIAFIDLLNAINAEIEQAPPQIARSLRSI